MFFQFKLRYKRDLSKHIIYCTLSSLQVLVHHLPPPLPEAADQEEGAGDDRPGVAGLLHLGPPRPHLAPRGVRGRQAEQGELNKQQASQKHT